MADLAAARAWIDRSRDKPHPAWTLAIEVCDGGPRAGTVAGSVAVARRLGLADQGVIDDDPWYGGPSRLFHVSAADWRGR